jgi:hypothetical protein
MDFQSITMAFKSTSFIKLDNEDIKFELETFQFAMNMFKDDFKR